MQENGNHLLLERVNQCSVLNILHFSINRRHNLDEMLIQVKLE